VDKDTEQYLNMLRFRRRRIRRLVSKLWRKKHHATVVAKLNDIDNELWIQSIALCDTPHKHQRVVYTAPRAKD
jgi:hypothetical protein